MSKRHSKHSRHHSRHRSSSHHRRSRIPSGSSSDSAPDGASMAQVISLPPLYTSVSPSASPSSSPSRSPKRGLVYFVPGNPGYVEYYRDFLLALRSVIDSSATQYHDRTVPSLHIYGRDLAGFQDDDHHPFSSTNPPVDVQGQVDTARRTLDRLCAKGCDGDGGRGFDFVILVGHSVGGYLALSLVHQYSSSLPIRHAILLFPTICHIAMSPRGRIARPLLNTIPPSLAARAARVAMWPWPRRVLRWTLGRVLGMEAHAAGVTERFLKSRDGVFEALWLARDEMHVIGEDRWGETFWRRRRGSGTGKEDAAASSSSPDSHGARARERRKPPKIPRFFMFFGKRDGWVDGSIRDEFIARTRGMGGVKAVIDGHGLPHAFCVNEFHSVVVAALIKDWIRDIQDGLVDHRPVDTLPDDIIIVEEDAPVPKPVGSANGSSSTARRSAQLQDEPVDDSHAKRGLFGWW